MLAEVVVAQPGARGHQFGEVGAARRHVGVQQRGVDAVRMRRVEVRPRLEVHLGAGLGQRARRRLDALLHAVVHRRDGLVQPDGDAQALQRLGRRRQPVLQAARIEQVGADGQLQRQRQIAGAARQRADHRQVGLGAGLRRQAVAALGHDAPGGLVAVDAAVGGRVADAAADVAAVFQRAQAGSDHGRAAARRAAGPARQVPGVVGGAVDRVVALEVGQVQRHVALAEDHRACRLEPVDHQRVRRGGVVLARQVAPGGGLADQVEGFLHRHRQAVQRAPELALGQRAVGGARTLAARPCGRRPPVHSAPD